MATPIDPQRFDGMRGLRVQEDRGIKGELDAEDIVVDQSGRRLSWDEQAYKDARQAFSKNESLLCTYKGSLQGIQSALDRPTTGKPDKKNVQQVLDGAACVRKDGPASQRSDAGTLMAWCEGIVAQHYTTMIWNRAAPGQRAIEDLQQALKDNPKNRDAAFSLTATLLAIRNSGHQKLVEGRVHVDTTQQLTTLLPFLQADPSDMRGQCAMKLAMDSLARDNALPNSYATQRGRLDQHLLQLRAANPTQAHNVDQQLAKFQETKK